MSLTCQLLWNITFLYQIHQSIFIRYIFLPKFWPNLEVVNVCLCWYIFIKSLSHKIPEVLCQLCDVIHNLFAVKPTGGLPPWVSVLRGQGFGEAALETVGVKLKFHISLGSMENGNSSPREWLSSGFSSLWDNMVPLGSEANNSLDIHFAATSSLSGIEERCEMWCCKEQHKLLHGYRLWCSPKPQGRGCAYTHQSFEFRELWTVSKEPLLGSWVGRIV